MIKVQSKQDQKNECLTIKRTRLGMSNRYICMYDKRTYITDYSLIRKKESSYKMAAKKAGMRTGTTMDRSEAGV